MAYKIFDTINSASSESKSFIHIEVSGTLTESAVYPAGYFSIKTEPLADPSAAHGWIKLIPVNGNGSEVVIESSTMVDRSGSSFASQKAAKDYLFGFFFNLPSSSGGSSSLPSETNDVTVSTSAPSGGSDGDIHIVVSA